MQFRDKNGFPIFLDGQFKDPASCPQSDKGYCPKCRTKLESGYGYAGDYGLGAYNYCESCKTIYDAVPDKE